MTPIVNSFAQFEAIADFQKVAASMPRLWFRRARELNRDSAMTRHSFACATGERAYYLYAPKTGPRRPSGIVVMLHGCKQTAVDFAAATRMNQLAERLGFVVVYPEQATAVNPLGCWKWYSRAHQKRGRGEPAILAGLTRSLCRAFGIPQTRTFVAGLSAGGAMAAVLGAEYPDVFAAVGVHSGLIQGAARDVPSAFEAMAKGRCGDAVVPGRAPKTRLIVFQGLQDQTVVPQNAIDLFSAYCSAQDGKPKLRVNTVEVGTRRVTHAVLTGHKNVSHGELWLIEETGHAWSGGARNGSFSEPAGPNASERMARFFFRPALFESPRQPQFPNPAQAAPLHQAA